MPFRGTGLTLHHLKRFTVPATTPVKRPCTVHHFVKGQCLRCPEKIVKTVTLRPITDEEAREAMGLKPGEPFPDLGDGGFAVLSRDAVNK